jgi:hypothetical protein
MGKWGPASDLITAAAGTSAGEPERRRPCGGGSPVSGIGEMPIAKHDPIITWESIAYMQVLKSTKMER